ncbi:MAG: UDP-N-acetylmuramoyl-tripeptide--D-alanyl-D-alanine ligase [Hyphomicrobiaceae bacterium]
MAEALWTIDALVAAAAGRADGDFPPSGGVTGISIDTRTLVPGELFVALKDQRDGHEFVPEAFAKGAVAALVAERYQRNDGDGLLIRVDDALKALERIGVAGRARLGREARVIAVTGSAGKTTTKEMLRLALTPTGRCHASDKSFNNHWGVPLTLARMPAVTRFGVFEIGMNHAGEITPLTRLVRPDVAIVTTVEAAHLAAFASVEDIARAKAEIMQGLEPGGVAVLNRDNPHYGILRAAAVARAGVNVVSFGESVIPQGDGEGSLRLIGAQVRGAGTHVRARLGHDGSAAAQEIAFEIGASGRHMVMNSLAALAACLAAGADLVKAAEGLGAFGPPKGRGSRQEVSVGGGTILLIDESYNANPASMIAALAAMASVPREAYPRRVCVLGDMLELGAQARTLHEALAKSIAAAGVDLVFAAGPMMRHLYDAVPAGCRGVWSEKSAGLEAALKEQLAPGDVVMVKGSNGSRMGPLVELVRSLGQKAA